MNLHTKVVNCPHEQIAVTADGLTRIKESQQFVWLGQRVLQRGSRDDGSMGRTLTSYFCHRFKYVKEAGLWDLKKLTMSPLLRL